MKQEMEAYNRLLREEMLETVALMEQKCQVKDKQMRELNENKISLRQEFTKVLQERNHFESELEQVSDRLIFQMTELERI